MKKKIVNVAVVGTGFGSISHIPAFNSHKKVKILAICGRNLKKINFLKKKYKIKYAFLDYEKVLKLKKIDLISLAIPPHLQYYYVKKAVEYNKHILCEKPFTTDSKLSIKLHKKINKKKIIGAVGYQMRFHPLRIKIKEIIKKGLLGKIESVHLSYDFTTRLYKEVKWNWWSNKLQGGGALNALGSHQIDLLHWWLGEIDSVFGKSKTTIEKRLSKKSNKIRKVTSDDIIQAVLFFRKNFNCTFSISSSAIGWKTSIMQIYGTKAALFLDGENKLSMIKKTHINKQEKGKIIKFKIYDPIFKKKWVDKSIWRASFFHQINNLVNAILNKEKYLGAKFYDGYKVRKVIEKILESSKKNKMLKVNYES